jgi:hypothetical protein
MYSHRLTIATPANMIDTANSIARSERTVGDVLGPLGLELVPAESGF